MLRVSPARLGLVCGLMASVLGGAAVAEEGVAFKNLLGNIGILPKEKDPIRYRERAPLVVPPKAELRPPARASASAHPEWPSDPDVVAKRRRAEAERAPVTWSETRRMTGRDPRLTPDELAAGRVASSPMSVPGSHRGDNARDVLLLSPDELRAGARRDDETPTVNGEPARRVLTDPPKGLRRSASGGAVKPDFAPRVDQQELDANPMTWLRQQFSRSDDD